MAARVYVAVASVIAGCAALALPGADRGLLVAVAFPLTQAAVADAEAVSTDVAPPASPLEFLPPRLNRAPAPEPVIAPELKRAPAVAPEPRLVDPRKAEQHAVSDAIKAVRTGLEPPAVSALPALPLPALPLHHAPALAPAVTEPLAVETRKPEQQAVRDALRATHTGLEPPAVVAPASAPPEILPVPTPLNGVPVPMPPAPGQSLPLPPIPVEAPPVTGGLTVDGRPIDLLTFRTRLGNGCATCGHSDCETCGGSRHCSPGRTACEPFPARNRAEQMIGLLYETVCCQDPCYEPKWTALADAAYFTASARPVSQTRFRWDAGLRVLLPDRAEYFWARADGLGSGPRPVAPNRGATRVNYHELSMYTELAVNGSFATIIDMPYRANSADGASPGAGFGDLRIGTKTLLFDRELVQVAFQFLTYLPTGIPTKGTGVGHVSLEPSLIVGLKLSSDTYLQAQFGNWIPLGGFPGYSGSVLQYNMSLNHVLWRPVRDVQLIGTCEFNALTFLDGAYTDPTWGPNQKAAGATYVSFGPGIRLNICDKMDFGAGSSFALTDPHFAAALFRTEFRYRY